MEESPIYDILTRDTLYLIAVEMDMPDLLAFCLSNRTVTKRICDDNRFWLFKLRHDFDFNETIYKDDAKLLYKFLYKNRGKTLDQHLILASKDGLLPIVKYMIKLGANINARFRNSPFSVYTYSLVEASKNGHVDVVRYLLEKRPDVFGDIDVALGDASEKGHTEVVRLLLDHGADVHAWIDAPLIVASRKGYLEIVRLLLDHGADVHARNDGPIREASENGHVEVVRLLLDRGADIRDHNDLALRVAMKNGHTEVVNLLKSRM